MPFFLREYVFIKFINGHSRSLIFWPYLRPDIWRTYVPRKCHYFSSEFFRFWYHYVPCGIVVALNRRSGCLPQFVNFFFTPACFPYFKMRLNFVKMVSRDSVNLEHVKVTLCHVDLIMHYQVWIKSQGSLSFNVFSYIYIFDQNKHAYYVSLWWQVVILHWASDQRHVISFYATRAYRTDGLYDLLAYLCCNNQKVFQRAFIYTWRRPFPWRLASFARVKNDNMLTSGDLCYCH